MVVDSKVIARKRARWQGRANVERFVEQLEEGHSAQRLRDDVEVNILRRFVRGKRLLDVGIGTGRVSLPLLENGVHLTGVDASAAMIERCGRDTRAAGVRLVKGELERLPFADEAFDTVMSVDTFVHFSDWVTNLDELLRVTNAGGRIIVDVGSRDHIDAVAHTRGSTSDQVLAVEIGSVDANTLRLSHAELSGYAAERESNLIAIVPFGAIFGSLVPNYWTTESYAFRSGGMDRLVSWIGADPLLFAFAQFIERRIVQELPPSASSRMFAVLERGQGTPPYAVPLISVIPSSDERGPDAWRSEFSAHVQHAPNRAFAVAFLMSAWPIRLPELLRATLPEELASELDRTEHAAHIEDICTDVVSSWRSTAQNVMFRGVNLSDALATLLQSELRDRLGTNT